MNTNGHHEPHKLGRERRKSPRTREARPCKVQDHRSGRFISATTRDLSVGGVMIEALWPTNIRPGDSVAVYLSQDARGAILSEEHKTNARVVRVLRGDAVILALEFDAISHEHARAAA